MIGCSSVKIVSVGNDSCSDCIKLNLKTHNIYERTCSDESEVFKKEGSVWRKITDDLSSYDGLKYYLDGKLIILDESEGCDVRECRELPDQREIYLRISEIVQSKTENGEIPKFDTVPLKGDLKYKERFYRDSLCLISKDVEYTFKYPPAN